MFDCPVKESFYLFYSVPPRLHANCENWDAGYSVRIVWDEPEGVWTAVEVNVTGKSPKKVNHGEHYTILPGFLPAKHYEVSLSSLSGIGKGSEQRSEPYVFSCATDPRGEYVTLKNLNNVFSLSSHCCAVYVTCLVFGFDSLKCISFIRL